MFARTNILFKKNAVPYLLLFAPMAMYLVFVVIPAFEAFYYSLTDWEGIGPMKFIGLKNYVDLFSKDSYYWLSLKNNAMWALGSATIPIMIGLLQANILVRSNVRHARLFQLIFFMPQIISTAIAVTIWGWIYQPELGPIGTLAALFHVEPKNLLADPKTALLALMGISIWLSYGFCTVVFTAAIQSVDEQLYEAAKIDGCRKFRQFFSITLPSISGSMNTVLLFQIIWSFTAFDVVYMMTQGGPAYGTYVISFYVYYEGFMANRVGFATALSVILTAIMLLISRAFIWLRERGD